MASLLQQEAPELDMHALFAIITGAVFYLTLRSDAVTEFNGVDIGSDAGCSNNCYSQSGLRDGYPAPPGA